MSEREHERHPPQEADELPVRVLVGVLFATLVISFSLGGWACAVAHRLGPPSGAPRSDAVEPRELVRSGLDHDVFDGVPGEHARRRAADRRRLDEWGWVDRERGIVHMPVDVAMRLYLQEPQQETAAR